MASEPKGPKGAANGDSFMFPGSRGKRGKRVKRVQVQTPEELRKLVLGALLRGREESPVVEYIHGDVEHWYLSRDAMQIPFAERGGREVVFTALIGPIHKRSRLLRKCGDSECVNPGHVSIMDRKEADLRAQGKWEDRIISPQFKVVARSEYEHTLLDDRVKGAEAQRKREARARAKAAAAKADTVKKLAQADKREAQKRWGDASFNQERDAVRKREILTSLSPRRMGTAVLRSVDKL